jgi:peroxiredoxin
MPDFVMKTLDGGSWSLASHRGSVVLLNFWATWCPPCRHELPGLVRLANTYRGRGVEVAGISMDEERELVRQFAAQHTISYPVLLPRPGEELASQVRSLPASLLIDREGRIAKTYVGAESEAVFRRDVEMLLAEQ